MNDDEYDKIVEGVSNLYNDDKGIEEIACLLEIPLSLVESILIHKHGISFR